MTNEHAPRKILLRTAPRPSGVITPRAMQLFLEENEDLYWEQVKELEKEYGGTLVTDKGLVRGLLFNLRKHVREKGVPPEILRPGNYPTEEFVPVCMRFAFESLGLDVDKWYFIRRPRVYVIGSIGGLA